MFNFSWFGYIVGGAAALVAVPWAIAGLGFTGAGITAGSIAAWMMSFYGGAVPPGGIVAVLQSIGAGGMGLLAKSTVAHYGGKIGEKLARFFANANHAEKEEFFGSLAACLMSPDGGNLDTDRASSTLNAFKSGGINAVRDWEGKAGLERCLEKIKSRFK